MAQVIQNQKQRPVIAYQNDLNFQDVKKSPFLSLSPSSIETFLKCPQKYFYQSMLSLKTSQLGLPQAFGLLVHTVMQQYYQQYFEQGEAGFEIVLKQIQKVVLAPVIQETILPFDPAQLNLMQRQQLVYNLQQAMTAFLATGFLQKYSQNDWTIVACEKWLNWLNPFGIENTQLTGRVDLVLKNKHSGQLLLVDFKTSKKDYADFDLVKCTQKLGEALLKQPDLDNEDFSKRLKGVELQLPLYALMLEHDKNIQQKPSLMALQFIRPALIAPSHLLCVSTDVLPQQLPMYQAVVKIVAASINQLSNFDPLGAASDCRYCDYQLICPKMKLEDEDAFYE